MRNTKCSAKRTSSVRNADNQAPEIITIRFAG